MFKFKCNNSEWIIEEVDEATINNEMKQDGTLGVTIYRTQKIMLLKEQANIIKTLKHELMHVWLYEYGHAQDDDTTYGYEDICEIVASSNDFINEIILNYSGRTVIKQDIDGIYIDGERIKVGDVITKTDKGWKKWKKGRKV